ncbi:pyruvate, phosphate dikinase [Mycolicibacterium madagascariense]|uniref:Pyruvate, phosphate dikinase n=1 Tax=Mycolicibacterium madagascariense TaxID=212765 RepID=A0A7I7XPM1_9MYCO|nr:pyruvate, phosphate dikinase [Mycolicibacterium madagascariense]MCV7014018.1 pyruvate, phosphate dikinase [Mycolicibacterium madagascariense]BBZ31043.1 pyruvate, phosphate dikinase [Mycolicibacterium madagascariense]
MTLGAGSRPVHAAHRLFAAPLDGSLDDAAMAVVGGKGRAIATMVEMGLPVPPAFCITSDWCDECEARPAATVQRMWQHALDGLKVLQRRTGTTFGAGPRPLLLSVRSSGATSMPGMLETVLDVGVDDAVLTALAERHSPEFAADVRERFRRGYLRAVPAATHVPADPWDQLRGAMEAVVGSWSSDRAAAYRAHRGADRGGIAIVVQAMVYGNLDEQSGTGVLFTRNPATGDATPFGEWLPAAQGDDVVSGTSDCLPLAAMRDRLPEAYEQLLEAGRRLERRAGDVQDVEFTVEAGVLWLLQSRVAQRSPLAAVRLALALRDEGLIDDAAAIGRVTAEQLESLATARPDAAQGGPTLATGVPACPGLASGVVCTTSDDAIAAADDGRDVILVRPTTSPDDIAGIMAAAGVVTEIGGASSHAAIVARELGIPAVVGCGSGTAERLAGRSVTVDGTAGRVHDGAGRRGAAIDDPDLRRFDELVRGVRGR